MSSTNCPSRIQRAAYEVTYRNLIGPLGGKRNVTAECVFVDAIADIAVFGTPDAQEEAFKAEAFEALTEKIAFKIGKLKPFRQRYQARVAHFVTDGKPRKIRTPARLGPPICASDARMLSLDGDWFNCRVSHDMSGGGLWFDQRLEQPVIGGMSGSPIVLPDGSAVGVVSTSVNAGYSGGPNPVLAAHLPGWLLSP